MAFLIDPPGLITPAPGNSLPPEFMDDGEMALQLRGYQLTTAEILYHLPDHPQLLQTYLWQDYDLQPKFPALKKFLNFWTRELDGKLHSVKLNVREEIGFAEFAFYAAEYAVH